MTSDVDRQNRNTAGDRIAGVGVLGAGLVTQAIHLPTLAGLADAFVIRKVMDIDAELAADVARRVGAVGTTDAQDIMDDPQIDVVVICSPNHLHAHQLVAACAAGKRVVLCEKPLAVDLEDVRLVTEAVRESGTRLVVGAMHVFDPAWTEAMERWEALETGPPTLIRSSIVLPPNSRFENWATEPSSFLRPFAGGSGDAVKVLTGGILGLAIHDLPLIRRLLGPSASQHPVVHSATAVEPYGYALLMTVGETVVELTAHMGDRWKPGWTLEALNGSARLEAEFPPSYVHGGSAQVVFSTAQGAEVFGPHQDNGYHGEWSAIAGLLTGGTDAGPGIPALQDATGDVEFALEIVDGIHDVQGKDR